MSWSAEQYLVFEEQRTRPVRDLLQHVPHGAVRRAVDIGCGPGNSTEVLASLFPNADVSGFDSSPEMIQAARKRLPALSFDVASVNDWNARDAFDLILANAVLQWAPNHDTLFPKLIGALATGGTLAVQMPDNMDEPAQSLMRVVAAERPWSDALSKLGEPRVPRQGVAWYHERLAPLCMRLDVWRTTYFHSLPNGIDSVVEWFMGSGLRPFLQALSELQQKTYLERYRDLLRGAYKVLPDGSVLLPFPRLFIVATR